MSFYQKSQGVAFAPGWFLADNEDCTRITAQVGGEDYAGTVKTLEDGRKIVPMGSVYPDLGIVYEDIDVTNGAKPASVVIGGKIYTERVEDTPVIEGISYVEIEKPVRPY